jgi:hypothetical protein
VVQTACAPPIPLEISTEEGVEFMRKYRYLAVAAAGVMVLAAPVGTALAASAHPSANKPVLTVGKASGPGVKNGAKIGASLLKGKKITFTIGKASVSCSSASFVARVVKNPSAKGKAQLSVTKETAGGTCTVAGAPISGVTLKSLTAGNLPYNAIVTAKGDKITITEVSKSKPIAFTAVVYVPLLKGNVSCTYEAASASGVLSNKHNTVTFTHQKLALEASEAKGLCPAIGSSTSYFSAALGPVTDTSVRHHPKVFVG